MPDYYTVIASSALILLIIVLRACLRRRVDGRWLYALWLLPALRLLWPNSWSLLPYGLFGLWQRLSLRWETAALRQAADVTVIGGADGPTTIYLAGPEHMFPLLDQGGPFIGGLQLSPRLLLLLLWLLGVVIMLMALLIVNLRLAHKLHKHSRPYFDDQDCHGLYVKVGGRSYNKFRPLRRADFLASPCLFGLFNPKIYLNGELDGGQLAFCLAHETVHYRRGDNWWSLLRLLCLTLHWYNPLVWWAAILSRRDCELACDATVLAGAEPEERLAYGETLLALARRHSNPLGLATLLGNDRRSLTQRLQAIVKKPTNSLGLVLLLLTCALALGSCGFVDPEPRALRETDAPAAPAPAAEAPQPELSLLFPLSVEAGVVTSGYGFNARGFHLGIDIAAPSGTEILAAAGGEVIRAEAEDSAYGMVVDISHGQGWSTRYAHCDEFYVAAGDWVEPGQAIAAVGMSGTATGPHLHFELRRDDATLDPAGYISGGAEVRLPAGYEKSETHEE